VVRLRETFPFSVYVSATTTQENGLSVGPGAGAINLGGKVIKADAAMEFGPATNFFLGTRTPRRTRNPWWSEGGFSRATRDNNIHNFREDIWETTDLAGYQFNPHALLTGAFHLLSLNSDQPGITPNPSGRDIVPSLSLGVRIDTRDHSLRPGLRQWAPARLRHWRTGRGLAGSCSLTGRVRFRRRDGL